MTSSPLCNPPGLKICLESNVPQHSESFGHIDDVTELRLGHQSSHGSCIAAMLDLSSPTIATSGFEISYQLTTKFRRLGRGGGIDSYSSTVKLFLTR